MKLELINEVTFDDPIQQVLHNRGIDDLDRFFNIDWSCVQHPTFLDNMNEGAQLLYTHLSCDNKILVIVDSDCDGFTSSAILLNYLHDQHEHTFPDFNYEIVYMFHDKKDHGLSDAPLMKKIRDEIKPNLVIIPDASGNLMQYQALMDLGMDILVIDHHDTEVMDVDTEHLVIINNIQSEDYENKALSGAGMVWQFCRYLDEVWGGDFADKYLPIVAIGLVADVMDLRSDETRFLVQQGIATRDISNFVNAVQFKMSYSLNDKYNPDRIGFVIAPLFNAIARIGSQEEKDLALKALLEYENNEMVKDGTRGHTGEVALVYEALRQMANAKSRQDTRKKKLKLKIEEAISEQGLSKNQIIFVAIDDFDADQRALSGLIANSLIDTYNRPIVLVFKNDKKDGGGYAGSARAPENSKVYVNFRQQCEDTGLCRYAKGHGQAFGIAFDDDKMQDFIEYFNKKYAGEDTDTYYNVDYIFDATDMDAAHKCLRLTELEDYYGQGIKAPLVAFTNVPLKRSSMALFKPDGTCPTLKITAPNGVSFIKFYSSREEFESLKLPCEGTTEQYYTATIVGECSANTYRGVTTLQIMIKDYEINAPQYDF